MLIAMKHLQSETILELLRFENVYFKNLNCILKTWSPWTNHGDHVISMDIRG